jgi:hypothetical protein
MSILAFLDPKFKKIWLKCQIFHEIIKRIRLIDQYFSFKMTDVIFHKHYFRNNLEKF